MWGTSSNYPGIRSFEQAERTYNNTKPLRGYPDFRPFDARSPRAKAQMLKHGTTYIIRLYHTDIVTYFDDGRVFINPGRYYSRTTAGAISAMSPFTCWIHLGEMIVSTGRSGYGDGLKFVLNSTGLMFKPNELDVLVPIDPPVAVAWKKRVNTLKAKQARMYFKQVPIYIKTLSAAFEGGKKPSPTQVSVLDTFASGEPLEEQQAIALAWGFISEDWIEGERVIINDPAHSISVFWRQVYTLPAINETYSVELPYGEVAK